MACRRAAHTRLPALSIGTDAAPARDGNVPAGFTAVVRQGGGSRIETGHGKTDKNCAMPAPEFLPRTALDRLLDVLTQAGYRCIGPQRATARSCTNPASRAGTAARRARPPGAGRIPPRNECQPALLRLGQRSAGPEAAAVRAARIPVARVSAMRRARLRFPETAPVARPRAVHRRAGLRPRGAAPAGPAFPRRRASRSRRTARGATALLLDRRPLHASGRHLLLRLDRRRAARRHGLSISRCPNSTTDSSSQAGSDARAAASRPRCHW